MDSNTHSTQDPTGPAGDLADLIALLDRMAARDLERLPDTIRAERVQGLRPLVHRLEGQWLKELAGLDARGATGAEQGVQFGSTASWLRARLRMTRGAATTAVGAARALFRGPSPSRGRRSARGRSRSLMPRCWPPAPCTCPTMPSKRPKRPCWTRPAARTPPGCVRWSPTPSTSSILTGLMGGR